MNANILFEIYEITRDKEQSDLVFGLAMYKVDHPEITYEEDKAIREFMGRHGQKLAKAFPNKEKFVEVVVECEKLDEEALKEIEQE